MAAGAIGTNAVSRYDLNSTREDLSDTIYNVDPVDTMFMSSVGREKSNNITKEWSVDTLSDASNNEQLDGDVFSGDALTFAEKRSNYHQISRRDLRITRRADIVNKPGRRSETAYQIMKEMKTLKNSVELAALTRRVGRVGTATQTGRAAGVPAWIRTHFFGGGGSPVAPTLTTGASPTPLAAGTVGSAQGLTEADILTAKNDVYTNSTDNANLLLLSPRLKQSLTGYLFSSSDARIARPEQNLGVSPKGKGATVMGAVDFWQTDFGTIRIVPSRYIPAGNASNQANASEVLLLNPEFWSMSYLTGFTTQDIPKDGDNRRKMLLVDWTVCAKNEAASAVITAVNQNTAVAAS